VSDDAYPLRPVLAADVMALRDLFAQSIEELTQDDYNEDQRAAWAATALDAEAFAKRIGINGGAARIGLVVQQDGEYLGFATLKDSNVLDLLYVHPYHAGLGVGAALSEALETLAAARGTAEITVEASDTAVEFFEGRGYVATSRNLLPIEDEWLSNTTMTKQLQSRAAKAAQ
jgi:putative acetyltransferase